MGKLTMRNPKVWLLAGVGLAANIAAGHFYPDDVARAWVFGFLPMLAIIVCLCLVGIFVTLAERNNQ